MAAARQNGNGNGNGRRNPSGRSDKSDSPTRARTPLKPAQREKFLAGLALGWTIRYSAAHAGIPRRQALYELRARDQAFSDAWDSAVEEGVEVLEQEARRRAVDGVEKPVFHAGLEVGVVREYSDQLLIFMLKAKRPHLYRERHEHRHEHRGAIDLRLEKLTDDELLQLEQLLEKAEG